MHERLSRCRNEHEFRRRNKDAAGFVGPEEGGGVPRRNESEFHSGKKKVRAGKRTGKTERGTVSSGLFTNPFVWNTRCGWKLPRQESPLLSTRWVFSVRGHESLFYLWNVLRMLFVRWKVTTFLVLDRFINGWENATKSLCEISFQNRKIGHERLRRIDNSIRG